MAGGRRSLGQASLAVVDQGVVSLSNFVTAMLVAKAVVPESFGVYMLLFSTLIILSSVSVSLVHGPARVYGISADGVDGARFLRSQLVLQLVLGGVLGGGALAAVAWFDMGLRTAVALALAVFFSQLQELGRTVLLIRQRLGRLLAVDLLNHGCRLVVLLLLWVPGILDVPAALLAMALGGALGAAATRLGREAAALGRRLRDDWIRGWRYGRWLLVESGVSLASTQLYIFFTALWLDLRAAAAFGAVQTLLNALNVLLVGTMNYATPVARSRLVGAGYEPWRRWLLQVGIVLVAVTVLVTIGLSVVAAPLLGVLFRPEYAQWAYLVPVLGVALVLRSANSVLSEAFRTAEQPQVGFTAKAVSAVLTLVAAYPLIAGWGILGAALGVVLTQATWSVIYLGYIYRRGTLDEASLRHVITSRTVRP